MTRRFLTAAALAGILSALTAPTEAAHKEITCSKDVLNCLKKAFKRCPKNVTFIQDRNTKLGMRVLPRGTPLTEKNIKGRPTYTVCTSK